MFAGCQVSGNDHDPDNDHNHDPDNVTMTMTMSEHGLGGRPEAAGGGQSSPAAGQHGRDPAQPRGDGHQVRIIVLKYL